MPPLHGLVGELAVVRLHSLQLINGPCDSLPNSGALDVSFGEQFIGALTGNDASVRAMLARQNVRRPPNVEVAHHLHVSDGTNGEQSMQLDPSVNSNLKTSLPDSAANVVYAQQSDSGRANDRHSSAFRER